MTFLLSLDNTGNSELPTQKINGISKENQSLLVNKVEISFFPKGPRPSHRGNKETKTHFCLRWPPILRKKNSLKRRKGKQSSTQKEIVCKQPKGRPRGLEYRNKATSKQSLTLSLASGNVRIGALWPTKRGWGWEDLDKSKLVERSPRQPQKLLSLKFAYFF